MLLSFSIAKMRPYIAAGIRQAHGEDIGAERVKRGTIRAHTVHYNRFLAHARAAHWTLPYDLHIWWKSRTKERECLGLIDSGVYLYPITIIHSFTQSPGGPKKQCLKIEGCHAWDTNNSCYFWSPGDTYDDFERFACADGFDSVEEFRDYFVPNEGDVFDAVLFKW